jgi:hypothetical protein
MGNPKKYTETVRTSKQVQIVCKYKIKRQKSISFLYTSKLKIQFKNSIYIYQKMEYLEISKRGKMCSRNLKIFKEMEKYPMFIDQKTQYYEYSNALHTIDTMQSLSKSQLAFLLYILDR